MPDAIAPRVGYVPYSTSLQAPGDRRRFAYYAAKRGIAFEIADPSKEYDLVVLSSRADISVWRRYPSARLVYDLIDSYLAIPRTDLKGQFRGLFKFLVRQSRHLQLDHWKAIGDMCARADAVVCSTEEQRRDIGRFCPNVHIILDAQMGVARAVKTNYSAHAPFRLVWEGLPQTLGSLAVLQPALERLRERFAIEMHVVTDPHFFRYLGRYGRSETQATLDRIVPGAQLHLWDEAVCADIICSCDVAVIPLPLDDAFAAGKPENKLLLFWRLGMPVVTSPTPAYSRAMRAAGVELLATDTADWVAALEALLSDEARRRQTGIDGRAYAEREFSEPRLLARWDEVFSGLGFDFGSRAAAQDARRRQELP